MDTHEGSLADNSCLPLLAAHASQVSVGCPLCGGYPNAGSWRGPMSGPGVGASPLCRAFLWERQPWLDLFRTSPHRCTPCPLRSKEPACGFVTVIWLMPGWLPSGVPIHPWDTHASSGRCRLILRASFLALPPLPLPASLGLSGPLPASPGLSRPCCRRWWRLVSQAAASQTADSKMWGPACSRPKPSGAILPESPCFSSCREEERKQSSDSGSCPPLAFCTLLGNRMGLVAELLQGSGSPRGGHQVPTVAL